MEKVNFSNNYIGTEVSESFPLAEGQRSSIGGPGVSNGHVVNGNSAGFTSSYEGIAVSNTLLVLHPPTLLFFVCYTGHDWTFCNEFMKNSEHGYFTLLGIGI